MKANLGVEKFEAIIIASGNGFADALAGSYLSTVKNAPILLSWGGENYQFLDTDNIDYIKANLAEDGVVYILGGTSAVPELYETELAEYEVKRLGGGSLAYSLKAPLILTMTNFEDAAVTYAASEDITTGIVLGGDGLISDEAVRGIFAMAEDAQILLKK